MRSVLPISVAIAFLGGCSKPVVLPKKAHIPTSFVRILNLTSQEYNLVGKDRFLAGPVSPGSVSNFNYQAARYGAPWVTDSHGTMRTLATSLSPGQVITYVVYPKKVEILTGEQRLSKSPTFATVCFRSLDPGSTSVTIDAPDGKKLTLDSNTVLVVDRGDYKLEAAKGVRPLDHFSLEENMAYTILVLDPSKTPMLLPNSPSSRPTVGAAQ